MIFILKGKQCEACALRPASFDFEARGLSWNALVAPAASLL